MSRAAALAAGIAALALMTGPHKPRLIWNATASVPVGLYHVEAFGRLAKGALVLVTPQPDAAHFAARRGYLPLHIPLLKHVAALAGDQICSIGARISINGAAVANRLAVDTMHRPLPQWQGCRTLQSDEVFLLNGDIRDSFDGRYFGPVPLSSIEGIAVPLWIR